MSDYYTLDENHNPVPCASVTEWALMFRDVSKRRVAHDEVNGYRVSTVFLGLDHSFGGPTPILFETMIFPGEDQWRYATWDEAVAGHATAVAQAMTAPKADP